MNATALFDRYAQVYEEALQAGLRISGEQSAYFATRRMEETEKALRRIDPSLVRHKAIDFGCGTGGSTQLLNEKLGFDTVYGLDVSPISLSIATERFHNSLLTFQNIEDYSVSQDADLVFSNGVFHHIPPPTRHGSLTYIHSALKPGGIFVLWENNPWNPGVHYIMRAIPFDHNAKKVFPHAAIQMLRKAAFSIVQLRFFFVFPRSVAFLRTIEPPLSRLPLGAQYQIIAVKKR
jgi:trans-aconitate methyltransferase